MKTILLTVFLALSAPTNFIVTKAAITNHQESEIPKSILDKIIEIAAGEWGVSEESLWDEYNTGQLTITDLGEGTYELYSAANGGPLIIVVEDHS